jgi:hypothetical protein
LWRKARPKLGCGAKERRRRRRRRIRRRHILVFSFVYSKNKVNKELKIFN